MSYVPYSAYDQRVEPEGCTHSNDEDMEVWPVSISQSMLCTGAEMPHCAPYTYMIEVTKIKQKQSQMI